MHLNEQYYRKHTQGNFPEYFSENKEKYSQCIPLNTGVCKTELYLWENSIHSIGATQIL